MRSAEEIVRVFVEEMWGTGNTGLIDSVVHEGYRLHGQPGGREFVRRNMRRVRTGFPDYTIRILRLVANEEQREVAVLFELTGTHLGTFGGIEPTGRSVTMLEAGFFTVEAGQVIAADWVSDGLGLRIQPGVLPEDVWTNPHR